MELFGAKRRHSEGRRGRLTVKIEVEELEKKYDQTLSFYLDPPDGSISLHEFEDYAIARLKLLRTIERMNFTSKTKYGKEWCNDLTTELKKQNLEYFTFPTPTNVDITPLLEARKFDHISHYILRLVYCRTEDTRRWMVNLEIDFFRYKYYSNSNLPSIMKFMEANNMPYKPMDKEKQKEIMENLQNASFHITTGDHTGMDYYEVPFTEVLDLVRGRKIFLRKGIAFIPYPELGHLFGSMFRSHLSQALAVMNKLYQHLPEDERITNILNDFDKRHTGRNFGGKKEKTHRVTVEMLPELSKRSFPLCMTNLYEVVKKESHIKHWGRLQLGLFFKGIGLPLEESTNYWRSNFMKKAGMDGSRFDKQYLYNIRHMYGQEGKRADYTPHSCIKIIMSSVGPGEHHGCPFRHSDPTPLRVKLAGADISPAGIKEIMELAEATHYSIACQKYFEWTHNNATVIGGINHPNQFFEESQKVLNGDVKVKAPENNVKRTTVKAYSKDSSSQPPAKKEYGFKFNDDDDIIRAFIELEESETQSQKSQEEVKVDNDTEMD